MKNLLTKPLLMALAILVTTGGFTLFAPHRADALGCSSPSIQKKHKDGDEWIYNTTDWNTDDDIVIFLCPGESIQVKMNIAVTEMGTGGIKLRWAEDFDGHMTHWATMTINGREPVIYLSEDPTTVIELVSPDGGLAYPDELHAIIDYTAQIAMDTTETSGKILHLQWAQVTADGGYLRLNDRSWLQVIKE